MYTYCILNPDPGCMLYSCQTRLACLTKLSLQIFWGDVDARQKLKIYLAYEMDGNIERAAYVTLKVDGFPFDEVYEVGFQSTIACSEQCTCSLDCSTGLAHTGSECRHGVHGAARPHSFLPHQILPARPNSHVHLLRHQITAPVPGATSECLLPEICHFMSTLAYRMRMERCGSEFLPCCLDLLFCKCRKETLDMTNCSLKWQGLD